MNVYVTLWTHRHGEDVSVFRTREQAENYRQEIATENWDEEIGEDTARPSDLKERADQYFDHMADSTRPEYFEVFERKVEE